jgi:hypothetical protein
MYRLAVRDSRVIPTTITPGAHTRDCQHAGGAGSSPSVVVPAAAFKLVCGEPNVHCVNADSGHTAGRAFCGDCGAPLFASTSARSDFVAIRAGSLDDPSWFQPQAEIWTASAQPWDHINAELPHFPRGRS